ncbi:acyl-CoA dehydrogenase [Bordetella pertussis]|nr:acyl-CoA dehydrogenase [Bordetella pertussis]
MISARLGDILSELYLLSAVLKRWEDEGRCHGDLALVRWCMEDGRHRIETRIDQVLSNLPNRPLAWLVRALILPVRLARGPSDALTRECAALLLSPSRTHDRLAADLQRDGDDPLVVNCQ